MKSKKLFAILFCGLMLILQTSCKKDSNSSNSDESDTSYDLSNKQAVSDAVVEDVNNIVFSTFADNNNLGAKEYNNISVDNGLPACANVLITGNFPNRMITINFGSGCIDTFGIFRSGIIHILLSDSARRYGSTARVTFDNYHVKKFKKEGTVIWTNLTPNGTTTFRTWSREVQNGKITDTTNGKFWLHTATKTITQYEGVGTTRYRLDDKYKIYSGNGSVTNTSGVTMSTTIIDTLFKSYICTHIDKGSVRFDRPNHYAILDYGNGTCDDSATLTIDGNASNTRAIVLP